MHIPDGFLSTPIWGILWLVTIGVVGYAVQQTNQRLGERAVPLMGVLSAFIFAGQMLNVPIAAGTSGHMLGGVLAAVFLGPWTATIIMASVFTVQTVLFQDGGLLAMGANIVNMGLIGTILGYYIFRAVEGAVGGKNGLLVGSAVAAWLAVVVASAATAVELALSGTSPLDIVLPAMVGVHAIIGAVEAAITVGVVGFVMKTRPDLLELERV